MCLSQSNNSRWVCPAVIVCWPLHKCVIWGLSIALRDDVSDKQSQCVHKHMSMWPLQKEKHYHYNMNTAFPLSLLVPFKHTQLWQNDVIAQSVNAALWPEKCLHLAFGPRPICGRSCFYWNNTGSDAAYILNETENQTSAVLRRNMIILLVRRGRSLTRNCLHLSICNWQKQENKSPSNAFRSCLVLLLSNSNKVA